MIVERCKGLAHGGESHQLQPAAAELILPHELLLNIARAGPACHPTGCEVVDSRDDMWHARYESSAIEYQLVVQRTGRPRTALVHAA